MSESVFFETRFILLVLCSFIFPISLYVLMMWKQAISRKTVLLLAFVMMLIAGCDVFLLQHLKVLAESTPSKLDNLFFSSELSVSLYLLPALFAGLGINMISHVLIDHLIHAEQQFDRTHPEPRTPDKEPFKDN